LAGGVHYAERNAGWPLRSKVAAISRGLVVADVWHLERRAERQSRVPGPDGRPRS